MDFPKIIVSAGVTASLTMFLVGEHCHLLSKYPFKVCEILTPHHLEAPDIGYPTLPSDSNLVSFMTGDSGVASATLPSPSVEDNFS